MSFLKADDRSGRGRSSSKSGRDRSRSRSNVRAPEAPEAPRTSYTYPSAPPSSGPSGSYSNGVTSPTYDVRTPSTQNAYFPTSNAPSQYAPAASSVPYPADDGGFTMGGYTDLPPHERPGYNPNAAYMPPPPPGQPPRGHSDEHELAYGSDSSGDSGRRGRGRQEPSRGSSYTSNAAYRYTPGAAEQRKSQQYQYAQAPDKVTYTARPTQTSSQQSLNYSSTPHGQHQPQVQYSATPAGQYRGELPRTYSQSNSNKNTSERDGHDPYSMPGSFGGAPPNMYERDSHVPRTDSYGNGPMNMFDRDAHDPYNGGAQVVDITPGGRSAREKLDRHNSGGKVNRLSTIDTSTSTALMAPRSPGLGPRMDRLSVSGNRPDIHALGGNMPPPSPMLEAYHGTYQSISPMPLAIRPDDDLDFEDLPPLSPAVSRTYDKNDRLAQDLAKKDKKRVKMYDPEEDAKAIADALKHHKPDADAICDVLPGLSHDQIMEVRKEYKKQVKVQGKGVNLSKHINMKLSGNFGKAVYVTALGRYESEGYWANFFYQSHGSRRELLIEALMGRTNAEVRMIKDEFKDKRYSDDLKKCMEKELKMDKFRTAVLMVLEERRQEEQDIYPAEYVYRDVDTLYRSVKAEKGGESAMLEIIIRRSDTHLKEVLRAYERTFNENFARAALKRSNNLVGEVIAHILNGVINKPARDSLLLQHAIRDIAEKNRDDELRYELLISRLVRMHWDRQHMARVKREYYEKYRITLEDAIEDATKGDFCEFMCELCDTKQK
ncbi:Annexin A7 [Pseudocercospora fuligena]|uniref:Annexin A7 n=1 Tax=Pseudocercospora fuligena TaxID=685502 RepID=A0A8H6RAR8_9PEZI|nr:Annexin A7 [Pseudocercospora fuligena]